MTRISFQEIFQTSNEWKAPFELDLGSAGVVQVEAMLRIMPGKRLVMKVRQNHTTLLLKVFRENHSYQKELKGYDTLSAANIATPKRLKHGMLAEGSFCFYEYIENLRSFNEAIEHLPEKEKTDCLQELLTFLGKMYQNKVRQEDLHFGNFAYVGNTLLALDPASCSTLHQQRDVMDNLALLLAQIPLPEWPSVLESIHHRFPDLDTAALEKFGEIRWKKRLQIFLKKIYRDCTYVRSWRKKISAGQKLELYSVRETCTSSWIQTLESIITPPATAEYLKRGGSSLVYTIEVDGRKRVIKQLRNKTILRLLRRCLRRSRASNAWYFSHLMLEAGIQTPKPIALVERKFGPLVLESWFVSDYIEGDNLLDTWLYSEPEPWQLTKIKYLFSAMRRLNISHGDMKATNLLICDNKIFVIDYDGAREHASKENAHKAIEKDKQRFLANWDGVKWKTSIQEKILSAGAGHNEQA